MQGKSYLIISLEGMDADSTNTNNAAASQANPNERCK